MKNKMKKTLAFLASMTMVATVASVLPYSNPVAIVASADGEETIKTVSVGDYTFNYTDNNGTIALTGYSKDSKEYTTVNGSFTIGNETATKNEITFSIKDGKLNGTTTTITTETEITAYTPDESNADTEKVTEPTTPITPETPTTGKELPKVESAKIENASVSKYSDISDAIDGYKKISTAASLVNADGKTSGKKITSDELGELLTAANAKVTKAKTDYSDAQTALNTALKDYDAYIVYRHDRILEIGVKEGDDKNRPTENDPTKYEQGPTGEFKTVVNRVVNIGTLEAPDNVNGLSGINTRLTRLNFELGNAVASDKPAIQAKIDTLNQAKSTIEDDVKELEEELATLTAGYDENAYKEIFDDVAKFNEDGTAAAADATTTYSRLYIATKKYVVAESDRLQKKANLDTANNNVSMITTAKTQVKKQEDLKADAESKGVVGMALSINKDATMLVKVYVTPGTEVDGAEQLKDENNKAVEVMIDGSTKCEVYTVNVTPKTYDKEITVVNNGLEYTVSAQTYIDAAESYQVTDKESKLIKAMSDYCVAAKKYLADNVSTSAYGRASGTDVSKDTYAGSSIIITDTSFVTIRNYYYRKSEKTFVSQTMNQYTLGGLKGATVLNSTIAGTIKTVEDYLTALKNTDKAAGDVVDKLIAYDDAAKDYSDSLPAPTTTK